MKLVSDTVTVLVGNTDMTKNARLGCVIWRAGREVTAKSRNLAFPFFVDPESYLKELELKRLGCRSRFSSTIRIRSYTGSLFGDTQD